jgi:hypothetical protein
MTLVALALGTFAIGTGEFGSNGVIQLFASDLANSLGAIGGAVALDAGWGTLRKRRAGPRSGRACLRMPPWIPR